MEAELKLKMANGRFFRLERRNKDKHQTDAEKKNLEDGTRRPSIPASSNTQKKCHSTSFAVVIAFCLYLLEIKQRSIESTSITLSHGHDLCAFSVFVRMSGVYDEADDSEV